MIKSIIVTNYLGDSIELELAAPEKSGFAVVSMDGLGPGKADINVSEVPTSDGGKFNSARVPSRNIVLGLIFEGPGSVEDIRQRSYKYFPLKRYVRIRVTNDNRCAEIEGFVESNEPSIFSKREGAIISIICPNPYYYANETTVTVFNTVSPGIEFPLSNESLTEKLLEFGIITSALARLIPYYGDTEVGVTIFMTVTASIGDINIYNTLTRERMIIDDAKVQSLTGSGIQAGDQIMICTVKGFKRITLTRNGEERNILNCLTSDSDWFELQRGDNIFVYTTGVENTESYLQLQIQNQTIYEGM